MSPKKLQLTALENASLLRKFTILFVLMSLLPISVLYYFYLQIREFGYLQISEDNFRLTLGLVVLGVLIGFWVMRLALLQIVRITKENTKALEKILGHTRIKELASNNENEIAILSQAFNEITASLEENVRKLELAKRTLHSVLSRVGEGISSMENIDNFLDLIVETLTEALSAKVGSLLLENEKGDLYVKSVYGVNGVAHKNLRIRKDEAPFAALWEAQRPLHISKMEGDSFTAKDRVLFSPPLLCAPLILHDKVLGIICVSGKTTDEDFKDEEVNLIFNIALQTAVAIENARLNEDVERTYLETISALAMAVEAKDPYSRGHLDRVARYSVQIAQRMNLPQEDVNLLRDAARLHDVGKIGVLDEVLQKPGKLTPEERVMMEKHVIIGESIIKPIRSLRRACEIIRHHHELLDGSGYPDKLKGEEINLLTRILTVADIYDALTTDRPYRKGFSREEVYREMTKMKDKLDQKVVEVLFEIV